MRPLLPAFSFLYGLMWDDLYYMPRDELLEYTEQIDKWIEVASSGMTSRKDSGGYPHL